MRTLRAITLVLFSSAVTSISASDSVFSDEAICAVARSSLTAFLEKIPVGHESRYGFLHRNEFGRATCGTPLRMYTDSMKTNADESSNRPVALNEWRVPVLVDGGLRSLLTVAMTDGVPEAVELGGAALAREVNEFEKKYHGIRRGLFRLYRLRCDFLMLDRTGKGFNEGEFHPLRSARLFFNAGSPSPRSRRDLFDEIHRIYRDQPAGH
jgi:hypothetical protein